MSEQLMNTKEVAEYLNIHEKQVYALIKSGRIPCTKVTGKWIFPRQLIDKWIEQNAGEGMKRLGRKGLKIGDTVLVAGSNDPVLEILFAAIRKAYPGICIFSASTGSMEGLKALNSGLTDIALSHLYDAESGKYNIPYLERYLPNITPVVVNLFTREIGFLVSKGKVNSFKGFGSLVGENIRFINRQQGSGIRVLLDYHLAKEGIRPEMINGYQNEVYTHLEVGLSIVVGEADVGIASAAISKFLNLPFLPIASEYFDMILDQSTYFQPAIQSFMKTLTSGNFKKRLEKIGGYDFKDSGKILYANP